jgi:hypothetical protein
MLSCASVLAFSGLAAIISVNGPFGNSTATESAAQIQPAVAQPQTSYQDDLSGNSGGQASSVQQSAPVARSRGS